MYIALAATIGLVVAMIIFVINRELLPVGKRAFNATVCGIATALLVGAVFYFKFL